MNTEREIWVTCECCSGEGSTEEARPQHDDPYFAITIKCERCGGSGWEHEYPTVHFGSSGNHQQGASK